MKLLIPLLAIVLMSENEYVMYATGWGEPSIEVRRVRFVPRLWKWRLVHKIKHANT